MAIPLTARRRGADVEVSGLPDLPGWRVDVHDDGSITVRPPHGERLSQPLLRRVPFGAVLAAADDLTSDDRLGDVVHNLGPVPLDARAPGAARDWLVVATYRAALVAGLPPREVLAALYGVPDQTAGQWITQTREAGKLGTVHEERAALARRTR